MSGALRPLAEIAARVASTRELDVLLGPVLRVLGEQLGLQRANLALVEASTGHVVIQAGHGLTPAEVRRGRYLPREGVIGDVVALGEAQLLPQVRADPRFVDKTGALDGVADRAMVSVPLCADDEVIGALSAYRSPEDVARLPEDRALLSIVAALLAPAAQEARAREESQELPAGRAPGNMIGRSKAMSTVYALVQQVAASPTTVLLRGESGTGKELVARALHHDSPRRNRPLVNVNCAALPDALIESELFGHERGAFTGALQRRLGRFELADGGTIFLDEIGDLSPATQIKLLRVLQEREFERVGSHQSRRVDVRVIAATSRDLEALMEQGTFREDLYYRLNVFPIRLPPLRERGADIVLLADHFVESFNRAHGRSVRRISTPALDMLMAYHWPGNVRELENSIERAVLLARDDVLHGHHLPPSLQTAQATDTVSTQGLKAQLAAVERELVVDALKTCSGNIAAAARLLQVTERIMGLRVARYAIDPRRFRNTTKM